MDLAEVYAQRRRSFMDRIGSTAAAILPAAPTAVRSHDVEYPYRADNDLLYLTGFPEPEAVCLLLPGRPSEEFILFVRPLDPERETWTGRRLGVDGAIERCGADRAFPIETLEEKIHPFLQDRHQLYYAFGRDHGLNERVVRWMRTWQQTRPRQGGGPSGVLDPGDILHEMRLIKSAPEVELMRRAIAIATDAHTAAMRAVRPGQFEYEIEALIDFTFRRGGAVGPAYPSIVASGTNATVLHYITNDRQCVAGDLLLIDAGAEFQGYCADITRTFPVGERFSGPQGAIYDIVLRAQLAAIDAVRPGACVDDAHNCAVEVIVDGLLALGILTGERATLLAEHAYRPFYMHRTGHWLGMDVHDVGKYTVNGRPRVLEPGMVVTVEPGIYVAGEGLEIPAEFRGIGVRIEDDVLVTAGGCEVLSAAVPKQVVDIEALRREGLLTG